MIPETDLIPTSNNSASLITIELGDTVARHITARYYMLQLDALLKAAEKIGGVFTSESRSDALPPAVETYLGYAVLLAREIYSTPNEKPWMWGMFVEGRRGNGYAGVFVRELLHELGMNGLHLHVGPEGYDSKTIEAQEEAWAEVGARYTPPASVPQTDAEIKEYVDDFFPFLSAPEDQ